MAIGGDVIAAIIVTGDANNVFVGDYELLRDAYLKPWEVYDRVNPDGLIGREWLESEIDAFILDHDCGYFVLEADAGMGKTTFLAWLARKHGLVHHFGELDPGEYARAIKSLGAQIVLAYHLDAYEAEGVLPGTSSRPDFFYALLREAASKRKASEKVVLVIDALDEAGTPYGRNVLGLPRLLPEGVFIIASQRSVQVSLTVDPPTPLRRLRLLAGSQDNVRDVEKFLDWTAKSEAVADALASAGISPQRFKRVLLDKSEGLWIYLHYTIAEITKGERWPLDLEGLPKGLPEYYARYWRRWRDLDREKWYRLYLPVLANLAAAEESVSAERLLEWAPPEISAETDPQRLRAIMREKWGAFLAISGSSAPTYRMNHATLQEFFAGETASRKPGSQRKGGEVRENDEFLQEIFSATRNAHARIADYYLRRRWKDYPSGLSGLSILLHESPDEIDLYGLRHVPQHLLKAMRIEELHRLFEVTRMNAWLFPVRRHKQRTVVDRLLGRQALKAIQVEQKTRLVWFSARILVGTTEEFLSDVALAWKLADERNPDTGQLELPRQLALQCRYALLTASVKSLSANVPHELLAALVETGVWKPHQALAYAVQDPDHHRRMKTLLELAPVLAAGSDFVAGAPQQGLTAAKRIAHGEMQSKALGKIAPLAPDSLWPEILDQAELLVKLPIHHLTGLREETDVDIVPTYRAELRSDVLARLAPFVPEDLSYRLLEIAKKVEPALDRVFALTVALTRAQPDLRAEALAEAQRAIDSLNADPYQVFAKLKIAAFLTDTERRAAIDDALATAASLDDPDKRDRVRKEAILQWITLDPAAGLDQIDILTEQSNHADVLKAVAPLAAEALLARVLDRTLKIDNSRLRSDTLAAITGYLSPALVQQIGTLPLDKPDKGPRSRLQTLIDSADAASGSQRNKVLREILAELSSQFKWTRPAEEKRVLAAEVFSKLASWGHLDDARQWTLAIVDLAARREAWIALLRHLPLYDQTVPARELIDDMRIGDANELYAAAALLHVHAGDPLSALRAALGSKDPEKLHTVAIELARLGYGKQAVVAMMAVGSGLGFSGATSAGTAESIAPHLAAAQLKFVINYFIGYHLGLNRSEIRAVASAISFLPPPERAVHLSVALSAARGLKNLLWKAESLSALARVSSDDVKREALQAISRLKQDQKLKPLAALAPSLPDLLIREALAHLRQQDEDKVLRAEAFQLLSERLPVAERRHMLMETLQAASAIQEEKTRVRISVKAIVSCLTAASLHKVAEAAARVNSTRHEQSQTIRTLEQYLAAPETVDVFATAQSWPHERTWSEALLALSTSLASAGYWKEALVLARAIVYRYSELIAVALASIVPCAPVSERANLIREALRALQDLQSSERRSTVTTLVGQLIDLPQDDIFEIWTESLHRYADGARKPLLLFLTAFAPAIDKLVGTQGLRDTIQAIAAVGETFP